MFPVIRFDGTALCISIAFAFSVFVVPVEAQEPSIEFDVPAMIGVREVLPSSFAKSKVVEILLPISTVIDSGSRGDVDEFRFDVSWNRSVYPLFDYGPRTQTVSSVEGLLTIEESENRSSGFKAGLSGKPFELASANLSSDVGSGKSKRKSFQEVPQHDILVASGTIDRGTGAFFRFHGSKRDTLEGGRDLILAYRVPDSWRNGILKVECRATGTRKVAGLFEEPFEVGRSFVVPLFIDGDPVGQQLAIDFARAEQGLRKSWIAFERKMDKKKNRFPFGILQPTRDLPDHWPHLLIQSGDDQYLSQYKGFLTQDLAVAAGKFVQVRSSMERTER